MADLLDPPLGPEDHVDGPPDAPLELVMYGDFQCPYCAAAQPILRRVRDRLDGRLRFAFRHFPLPEVHPDAQRAAEASEAAAAQGAFWAMHDALYAPARAARARRRAARPAARPALDAERVRAELERACTRRGSPRDAASARAGRRDAGRRRSSSTASRHSRPRYDAQSLIARARERGSAALAAQLGQQLRG